MGAFEYTALDAGGRSRKGVIEGDTPRHVRTLLRERQLMPVTVEEVAARESRRQRGSRFGFARGVSAADTPRAKPKRLPRWRRDSPAATASTVTGMSCRSRSSVRTCRGVSPSMTPLRERPPASRAVYSNAPMEA